MYYVYMLRCMDNTIYTGITVDIKRRMKEHFSKNEKCAKYTYTHLAKKLEAVWECENKSLASKLEYAIKRLTKQKKEELIKTKNLENVFYNNEKIDIENYKITKKTKK